MRLLRFFLVFLVFSAAGYFGARFFVHSEPPAKAVIGADSTRIDHVLTFYAERGEQEFLLRPLDHNPQVDEFRRARLQERVGSTENPVSFRVLEIVNHTSNPWTLPLEFEVKSLSPLERGLWFHEFAARNRSQMDPAAQLFFTAFGGAAGETIPAGSMVTRGVVFSADITFHSSHEVQVSLGSDVIVLRPCRIYLPDFLEWRRNPRGKIAALLDNPTVVNTTQAVVERGDK